MSVYVVPSARRYWVVRAESGLYYDHFTRHGVIALGHLNVLDLASTTEDDAQFNWEVLQKNFKSLTETDPNLKQIGKLHLSQAKSFLYEMSVGDWVMTIGAGSVRFGRIISKPFIERRPIVIVYDPERGPTVEMDMHLRRSVQWGPSILRQKLPYGLLLSLKANQTVFCMDAKWEAIYHTLYAAFRKDNLLYLSAKITTEQAIKNHNISTIFKLLDEVEIIGKEVTLGNSGSDFENVVQNYLETDSLTITTKAQFHSPGDIWNAITGIAEGVNLDSWATYTVVAYAMIFGNQKMGFDGLVDIETRKKIWDLVLDRMKSNRAEKVVSALQIELPNIDTSKLEDNSKDRH